MPPKMKEHITNLKATRELIAKVVDGLSIEQINTIPKGFNNNIAWNLGHMLVTQQLLIYALSGTKTIVPSATIELFRKGTAPEKQVSKEQLQEIMEFMNATVDQLAEDLAADIFGIYKEYPTSYGVVLHSVEQAVVFNNMHEALHLGYIMAMKRALEH
jgi:uncharacterized damage-inducible protein DinB